MAARARGAMIGGNSVLWSRICDPAFVDGVLRGGAGEEGVAVKVDSGGAITEAERRPLLGAVIKAHLRSAAGDAVWRGDGEGDELGDEGDVGGGGGAVDSSADGAAGATGTSAATGKASSSRAAKSDVVDILKELALSVTAAHPFDERMHLRLAALDASLARLPAGRAADTGGDSHYRPRIMGSPRPFGGAHRMGLGLVASMLHHAAPHSEPEFAAALLDQLMPIVSRERNAIMFSQWSPPPRYEVAVDISGADVGVTSSAVITGSARSAIDGRGRLASCQLACVAPGTATWQLQLPTSARPTAVVVRWNRGEQPARVVVHASEASALWPAGASPAGEVQLREPETRVELEGRSLKELQLTFTAPRHGGPGVVGFWDVTVYEEPNERPVQLKSVLWELARWLLGATASGGKDMATTALEALLRLALSSASLSVLLVLARALQVAPEGAKAPPDEPLNSLEECLNGEFTRSDVESCQSLAVAIIRLTAGLAKSASEDEAYDSAFLEEPFWLEASPEMCAVVAELLSHVGGSDSADREAHVRDLCTLFNVQLSRIEAAGVDPIAISLGTSSGASAGATGDDEADRPLEEDRLGEAGAGSLVNVVTQLLTFVDEGGAVAAMAADVLVSRSSVILRGAPAVVSDRVFGALSDSDVVAAADETPSTRFLQAFIAQLTSGASSFLQLPPSGDDSEKYADSDARRTTRRQLTSLVRASSMSSPQGAAIVRPLLTAYQRDLVKAVQRAPSDAHGPCVALADYAVALIDAAADDYELALRALDGGSSRPVDVERGVAGGVGGNIMLELITGLCLFWRRPFVADSVLPSLCSSLAALDRLVSRLGGGLVAVETDPLPSAGSADAATLVPVLSGAGPRPGSSSTGAGRLADSPEGAEARFAACYSGGMGGSGAPTSAPLLLELEASMAWLGARLSGLLVSGVPLNKLEVELRPWLETPLLSAGVDEPTLLSEDAQETWYASGGTGPGADGEGESSFYHTSAMQWERLMQRPTAGVSGGAGRASPVSSASMDSAMTIDLVELCADGGAKARVVLSWLNSLYPLKGMNKRRSFVDDELEWPTVCALLKHAGLLGEAAAALTAIEHGGSRPAKGSPALKEMWGEVAKLRKWLWMQKKMKDTELRNLRTRVAEEGESKGGAVESKESKDDSPSEAATSGSSALDNFVTFDVQLDSMRERARFLLCLSSTVTSSRTTEDDLALTLDALAGDEEEKAAEQGRGEVPRMSHFLHQFMRRSKAAQNGWAAAIAAAGRRAQGGGSGDESDSDDLEEAMSPGLAAAHACVHYLQHGDKAPPLTLVPAMGRRCHRGSLRARGLAALNGVLRAVSIPSLLAACISQIRPALRGALAPRREPRKAAGFHRPVVPASLRGSGRMADRYGTGGAEESKHFTGDDDYEGRERSASASAWDLSAREASDDEGVESTPLPSDLQATAEKKASGGKSHRTRSKHFGDVFGSHHPQRHLDGAPVGVQDAVRTHFAAVYERISELMGKVLAALLPSSDIPSGSLDSTSKLSPGASRLLNCSLWAWAIDFEQRDFGIVDKCGILPLLGRVCSISTRARQASTVAELLREVGSDSSLHSFSSAEANLSLHPWGRLRVRRMLVSGALSKKELLWHMRCVENARRYRGALREGWWASHGLEKVATNEIPTSSLLEAYDDFVVSVFGLDTSTQPKSVALDNLEEAVFQCKEELSEVGVREAAERLVRDIGPAMGMGDDRKTDSDQSAGDDELPPPTFEGDVAVQKAAAAIVLAQMRADEQFGSLSVPVGLPPAVRTASWALWRFFARIAPSGGQAARAGRLSSVHRGEREAASRGFHASLRLQQHLGGTLARELQDAVSLVFGGVGGSRDLSKHDTSHLEPLELEIRLFSLLRQTVSMLTNKSWMLMLASKHLVTSLLRAVWTMPPEGSSLRATSPRCRRLALRALVLLSPVTDPSVMDAALVDVTRHLQEQITAEGLEEAIDPTLLAVRSFARLLLVQAGQFVGVLARPSGMDLAHCAFGHGRSVQVFAAEALTALRDMCDANHEWRREVRSLVADSLLRVDRVLPTLSHAAELRSGVVEPAFAEAGLGVVDMSESIGAFALLGGPPECLRVGGRVRLTASDTEGILICFGRSLAGLAATLDSPIADVGDIAADEGDNALVSSGGRDIGERVASLASGVAGDAGVGRAIVSFDGTLENVRLHDLEPVTAPAEEMAAVVLGDGERSASLTSEHVSFVAYCLALPTHVERESKAEEADLPEGTPGWPDTPGTGASASPDFLTLAVHQLQLYVVRALKALLTNEHFAEMALKADLLGTLFQAALRPLKAASLAPVEQLQARHVTLWRWLLESSAAGGGQIVGASRGPLGLVLQRSVSGSGTASPEAQAAAAAAIAALDGEGGGGRTDPEGARSQMAAALEKVVHKPQKLCYHALLLNGDDREAAAMWLLTGSGREWEEDIASGQTTAVWACTVCTSWNERAATRCETCDAPRSSAAGGAADVSEVHESLSNEAALEGVSAAAELWDFGEMPVGDGDAVPEMSRQGSSRSLQATGGAGGAGGAAGAVSARSLGPSGAMGEELDVGAGVGRVTPTWVAAGHIVERVTGDAGHNVGPGNAVFIGSGGGAVPELSCPVGIVQVADDEFLLRIDPGCVPVTVYDFETGSRVNLVLSPSTSLHRPSRIAGVPADHLSALRAALVLTNRALSTHFARLALVSLLSNWPGGLAPSLSMLGGAQQLISLFKLVAASEGVMSESDAKTSRDARGAASGGFSDNGSTMQALQDMMTTLLQNELAAARGERDRAVRSGMAPPTPSKWACGVCTLLNEASASVCALCDAAKPPHAVASTLPPRLKSGPLGLALVEEVHNNIENSVGTEGEGSTTIESLHPHPAACAYSTHVEFKGASALRVVFHPHCALAPNAKLTFSRSSGGASSPLRVLSGLAPDTAPFVVHADRLHYSFSSIGSSERQWGYRAVVTPIWKLQWLREDQVLTSPSLEWGTWLMRFLMNEAPVVEESGALHSARLFDALVRYLRSPAVPYKQNVIDLLAQVLSKPHLFDIEAPPNLDNLWGVGDLVMSRCAAERLADHLFLPQRLLELVQLTVLMKRARRVLSGGMALTTIDPDETGLLDPPPRLVAAPDSSEQEVDELLIDIVDVTNSIVEKQRMPDHILYSAIVSVYRGRPTATRFSNIARRNAQWTNEQDEQLVQWINDRVAATDKVPSDLDVRELELSSQEATKYQKLSGISIHDLRLRASILIMFNVRLERALPYIDLAADEASKAASARRRRNARVAAAAAAAAGGAGGPAAVAESGEGAGGALQEFGWSVGAKLRNIGHCVFTTSKMPLLQEAIDKTWNAHRPPEMRFHRGAAFLSKDRHETSITTSRCLFVQAFRMLNPLPAELLRCRLDEQKHYLFPVKFVSFGADGRDEEEPGLDWGGLYRECMNTLVDDIFDPETLDLFVPVPNAVNHVGENGDLFLPNPKHVSPVAMGMFEFVGKLMGIAMRTKNFVPLLLPSMLWKPLVGQRPSLADLAAVDQAFVQFLGQLRESANRDEPIADLVWTVPRTDGIQVPLVPGGARRRLLREEIPKYCDLATRYRLHEFDRATSAMLRGLGALVPPQALRLLTWSELNEVVCGSPFIDAKLLRAHTTYATRGYDESDRHIRMFWNVFESFTQEERVLFLRFCWGRTRLPAPGRWVQEDGPISFKITKLLKMGRHDDKHLPLAHTCFFQIELPPYTSEAVMKKKLLIGMHFAVGYVGNR